MGNVPCIFLHWGLDQGIALFAHSHITTVNLEDHGYRFNAVRDPIIRTGIHDVPFPEAQ